MNFCVNLNPVNRDPVNLNIVNLNIVDQQRRQPPRPLASTVSTAIPSVLTPSAPAYQDYFTQEPTIGQTIFKLLETCTSILQGLLLNIFYSKYSLM